MRDFHRISGLTLTAMASYLVSLCIVAVAITFRTVPFTSKANVPAAVIAAVAAAASAALLAAAAADLSHCKNEPCGEDAVPLRTSLVTAAASIALFAAALAALALIGALRFAGSGDAATLCIWAKSLTSLVTAVALGYLGSAIQGFNACLDSAGQGNSGATATVILLAILIIATTLVMNGHGVINGAIPVPTAVPVTG